MKQSSLKCYLCPPCLLTVVLRGSNLNLNCPSIFFLPILLSTLCQTFLFGRQPQNQDARKNTSTWAVAAPEEGKDVEILQVVMDGWICNFYLLPLSNPRGCQKLFLVKNQFFDELYLFLRLDPLCCIWNCVKSFLGANTRLEIHISRTSLGHLATMFSPSHSKSIVIKVSAMRLPSFLASAFANPTWMCHISS